MTEFNAQTVAANVANTYPNKTLERPVSLARKLARMLEAGTGNLGKVVNDFQQSTRYLNAKCAVRNPENRVPLKPATLRAFADALEAIIVDRRTRTAEPAVQPKTHCQTQFTFMTPAGFMGGQLYNVHKYRGDHHQVVDMAGWVPGGWGGVWDFISEKATRFGDVRVRIAYAPCHRPSEYTDVLTETITPADLSENETPAVRRVRTALVGGVSNNIVYSLIEWEQD